PSPAFISWTNGSTAPTTKPASKKPASESAIASPASCVPNAPLISLAACSCSLTNAPALSLAPRAGPSRVARTNTCSTSQRQRPYRLTISSSSSSIGVIATNSGPIPARPRQLNRSRTTLSVVFGTGCKKFDQSLLSHSDPPPNPSLQRTPPG